MQAAIDDRVDLAGGNKGMRIAIVGHATGVTNPAKPGKASRIGGLDLFGFIDIDHSLRQVPGLTRLDGQPVQRGTKSTRPSEGFAQSGHPHHANLWNPANQTSKKHTKQRTTGDEGPRAVDRVNDPKGIVLTCMFAKFLAKHAIFRESCGEAVTDEPFRVAISNRHRAVVVLGDKFQGLAEIRHWDGAGAFGDFNGLREQLFYRRGHDFVLPSEMVKSSAIQMETPQMHRV